MALRFLLVDDSPRFLAVARELLEREGIEVVATASTIDDAVRLTGALHPDLCIVDIDLGDESGFDLARRLAEPGGRQQRVLLTSAYPERDFRDMIEDSPALGFLPKPELSAARIRAMFGTDDGGEPPG